MASLPASTINVALQHPVPDLQSLQGAYVGNIERLEEHAERMSEPGSDLGEEIRRLHTELKRSDSRRSESLRSGIPADEPTNYHNMRSRNVSVSSHAASIVDLNNIARAGGYSPAGYVTSPVGSLRSGSVSNPPLQRQRSGSKASRLGQIVQPSTVVEQRRVSSFTRQYDDGSQGMQEDFRNSINFDQLIDYSAVPPQPYPHHQYTRSQSGYDRPATAASTDTTHQARTLWQDFDGVHCPDTVPEEESMHSHSNHSRQSSYMRHSAELSHLGAPPPDDSMVFYPAPVPKMLNLPKRLSQMPASSVRARRQTQLLESMKAENRKSAPLLNEISESAQQPTRKNRQTLANLPPQLRASAYFDQAAPSQEFAVQSESAGATLDSILDASAGAPVSAFTDHPFAGHVGKEVYGTEHKRKSSAATELVKLEEPKRRSSFLMLDTKRNSSGDRLNKLKKRNSSADMNLLVAKASESRMSLGDELDRYDEHVQDPAVDPNNRHSLEEHRDHDGASDEERPDRESGAEDEEKAEVEEDEEEPLEFGPPTTLLAELQLRKAKQKTRNMNYATLVEQGMLSSHRTLLELDDEAEKAKQKRIRKKVQLAWEAQDSDDSDDNVPLAVLYKQASQQQDWDRPLGLIAQRELEDSEPLSRRRNRLRGDDPSKARSSPYLGASGSQINLTVPAITTPGLESDGDENETLGERMRRLKDKQTLDSALGNDVRKSTISGDFASEMLSKLGVHDEPEQSSDMPKPSPSPGNDDEEETLGQRRARLKAEAAARGESSAAVSAARPPLRQSMSMADVLSANPMNEEHQARKVSNEAFVASLAPGSLLRQNEAAEERRKAQRMTQNMRSSSYGSFTPLISDANEHSHSLRHQPSGTLRQQPNMYGNQMTQQMPGMNMMQQPMMPMQMNGALGMNMLAMNSQMSLPYMQMGMQQQNMGMGMPMSGMNGMHGMNMNMNMNMPMAMNMNMGMNGGMQMGMQPMPMDPRQRDQIDRWMQGIRN